MKPAATTPTLEERRAAAFVALLRHRLPGFAPGWRPAAQGPGAALLGVVGRQLEILADRLNQAPDKHRLAFLQQVGLPHTTAQAARAPLVFALGEQAPAVPLPTGSQVAAPPPPGGAHQIVFETESQVGLSAMRLDRVVGLWPGRDQWIDHGPPPSDGEGLLTFDRDRLVDTPHALYLAHEQVLALSGNVRLEVEFELSQAGSEHLDLVWEYWDGAVWRHFKLVERACDPRVAAGLDSTAGLTRDGRYRLEADCAESATRALDGAPEAGERHWLRARLDEPLPLEAGQILPEVSRLRLSTILDRPVRSVAAVEERYERDVDDLVCTVRDGHGVPIPGALVQIVGLASPPQPSDDTGAVRFSLPSGATPPLALQVEVVAFTARHVHDFVYAPSGPRTSLQLDVTLHLDGLQPDVAYADAEELDLSTGFRPFGANPRPGATWSIASDEAFAKPGARVQLHLFPVAAPEDSVAASAGGTPLARQLHLEYWNGRRWTLLRVLTAFTGTSMTIVELIVPDDSTATTVNDAEHHWLRFRLVSGGFGYQQTVSWQDGTTTNTFTYVVPQPPTLAALQIAYHWERGPVPAERVLAHNDFRFRDVSEAARLPGPSFRPFAQLHDRTPALYLGFDRPPPVDLQNLYIDRREDPAAQRHPPLIWEHFDGLAWQPLAVVDETVDLRYPGMLSFIGPERTAMSERFGHQAWWLRGRLREDGPPPQARIDAIHPNAVWAVQRETVTDEVLGQSAGRANESFAFGRLPVLDEVHLEVRELQGARAAVEWRILASTLFAADAAALQELEDRLGNEQPERAVVMPPLRLERDRRKQVTEVWVRWQIRADLLRSAGDDRHAVVDRGTGRLRFGDGLHGMIPPAGARILARSYRSGGGAIGNVAAGSITQLLAGVAGVEGVGNPRPAEGGADAEHLAAYGRRAPYSLRHRGRGVTASDLAAMVREASPAVGAVRVLPARDGQGRRRPGWVTVLIIPAGEEPRPWPSRGLRERVRRHLLQHAHDALADGHLVVTGPRYQAIDVALAVVPREADQAGSVEAAVREALGRFLHPLHGGRSGRGWPPGRDIFASDLALVLERLPGVDHLPELGLLLDGAPRGERIALDDEVVPVAGELRIAVLIGSRP